MKRSEVVKIIADFVERKNWVQEDRYCNDFYSISDYDCGLLLKEFENIGLLPAYDSGMSGSWEPEDD